MTSKKETSVKKKIDLLKLLKQSTVLIPDTLHLEDLKNKIIVLYFYPKDSTPGCTVEGHEFNNLLKDFKKRNTVILGVSRDSLKSHCKFKEKQGYNFELISDENETLCKKFDVIKEKNMYGKKVLGIERSTFLISSEGLVLQEWRKVKAQGHAAEVLESLKNI